MSGTNNEVILRAGLDTAEFEAGLVRIQLQLDQVAKHTDEAAESGSRMEGAFEKLRAASEGLGGILATLGVSFGFDELVKVNGEYERLTTALINVTGSAAGAHQVMQNLIGFANQTPYTLSQVTEAFLELRNAGLDASTKTLDAFTNIASGFGVPIGQVTHAITDAVVGISEPLKQFGIEMQTMGDRVTFTFRGVTETVQRSAQSISAEIASIGERYFAGDRVRQSQTIEGMQSTVEDKVQNVLRAVGDGGFNNAYRAVLQTMEDTLDKSTLVAGQIGGDLAQAITLGIGIWKEYGTEIAAAAAAITGVVTAAAGLAILTTILNPITVAVGAAVGLFVEFKDHMVEIGGEPMTVLQAMQSAWDVLKDRISAATSAVDDFMKKHPGVNSFLQHDPFSSAFGINMTKPDNPNGGWASNLPDISGYLPGFGTAERLAARSRMNTIGLALAGTAPASTAPAVSDAADLATVVAGYVASPSGSTGGVPTLGPLDIGGRMALDQQITSLRADMAGPATAAAKPDPGLQMLDPAYNPRGAQWSAALARQPGLLDYITRAAAQRGIPLGAALAVFGQETGGTFDNSLVSPTGARGLGQLLTSTVERPGYGLPGNSADDAASIISSPERNIDFSLDYLEARSRYNARAREGAGYNPNRPLTADELYGGVQGYGTTSLSGNLNSVTAQTGALQVLAMGLRANDPMATLTIPSMAPQASAHLAQLQQNEMLSGETGLRRELDEALIKSGYTTQDASTGRYRSLSEDEVRQRYNEGRASAQDVLNYQGIVGGTTFEFNRNQAQQQRVLGLQAQAPGDEIVAALRGPLDLMRQQAEEQVRISAAQRGEPAGGIDRQAQTEFTRALNDMTLAVARGTQALSQRQSQQDTINSLTANAGVRFDPVSMRYETDTSQIDYQRTLYQLDPNNVRSRNPALAAQVEAEARQSAAQVPQTQQAQELASRRTSAAGDFDIQSGAASGLEEFSDNAVNVSRQIGQAFSQTFTGISDDLAKMVVTGRVNWQSLAQTAEESLARIPINALLGSVAGVGASALGAQGANQGLFGLFGGLFGGGGGAAAAAPDVGGLYALGGAFNRGLSSFSNGIYDQPQSFRFASGAGVFGEAGPEAIIPLQRDSAGRLGISGGGGGGGVTVHAPISVGNAGMSNGTMDPRTQRQFQSQIEKSMGEAVRKELVNQQKSGGQLYNLVN